MFEHVIYTVNAFLNVEPVTNISCRSNLEFMEDDIRYACTFPLNLARFRFLIVLIAVVSMFF